MIRDDPQPPGLDLSTARDGGRTLVKVVGEIDLSTVGDFSAAVRDELAHGSVLLDMSETVFMDSTGVRALDALLQDGERDGRTLTIGADMHRNVRHVLELTGMLDVVAVTDRPAGGAG